VGGCRDRSRSAFEERLQSGALQTGRAQPRRALVGEASDDLLSDDLLSDDLLSDDLLSDDLLSDDLLSDDLLSDDLLSDDARSDHALSERVGHCVAAVPQVEAGRDLVQDALHGPLRERKCTGDLVGVMAVCEEPEDGHLSLCEPVRSDAAGRQLVALEATDLSEQAGKEIRGHGTATGRRSMNLAGEPLRCRLVAAQDTHRARLTRHEQGGVVERSREDENLPLVVARQGPDCSGCIGVHLLDGDDCDGRLLRSVDHEELGVQAELAPYACARHRVASLHVDRDPTPSTRCAPPTVHSLDHLSQLPVRAPVAGRS